ncbi:MucR family transcriptional regulator [Sphingobium sp. TB-6]|uniref:MucR family transcriptional regulator n=1 Tax=Sphingobium sp. TB-6 TaxID=2728850 RepID=UPI00146D05D4|nr:MucR family transcriptional regulator [Sphingobium sp. TB-6]NML90895.1 MucR family transcriptional regulator [Sphingobium sp. TB-6]
MSENNQPDITTLTVQLVSAFVSNNNVGSEGLAELIRTTRLALTDDLAAKPAEASAPTYTPAVSVRKSLSSPDHILSMIDGKPYKTLKRHLASHGLTPNDYRERYGLPKSYPLVAPNYSEARRAVATKLGLGRKPVNARKAPEPAAAPVAPKPAVTKPAPAGKPAAAKAPAKAADTKTPAAKAKQAEAKAPAAKPVEAKAPAAKTAPAKAPTAKAAASRKRLSIATPAAPKKDAAPAGVKPADKAAAGDKPATPAKTAKKKPAAKPAPKAATPQTA